MKNISVPITDNMEALNITKNRLKKIFLFFTKRKNKIKPNFDDYNGNISKYVNDMNNWYLGYKSLFKCKKDRILKEQNKFESIPIPNRADFIGKPFEDYLQAKKEYIQKLQKITENKNTEIIKANAKDALNILLWIVGIALSLISLTSIGELKNWYLSTHDNFFSKIISTEDFGFGFVLIGIAFFFAIIIFDINFRSKEKTEDSNIFKFYLKKILHKQLSLFSVWIAFKNYWKAILISIVLISLFLFDCWLKYAYDFSLLGLVIIIWIIGIYKITQIIESK